MEKLSGSLQENLLTLLCWSDKFALIRNSVEPKLFTTDIYRDIITRVFGYIDQFKKPPRDHLPDLLEDALKGKNKDLYKSVVQGVYGLKDTINEEYALSQLEKFVRLQNLKLGMVRANDAIQQNDPDRAEVELNQYLKAKQLSFDRGITLSDVLVHLNKTEGKVREGMPLGIPELDRYHLGPARKEYHHLLAPMKAGKSWWLMHLAKRGLIMGHKVAVVTLELGANMYGTRILQSLHSLSLSEADRFYVTRFDRDELGRVSAFTRDRIERKSMLTPEGRKRAGRYIGRFNKNLRIKEFPSGSLSDHGLQAYLDSLEQLDNFIPDLLLVDYPMLMKPSDDDYRLSLGRTIVNLRGIAGERNIAVAGVGQSNREGVKAGTTKTTDAAEDFSVNMTADVVLTYSQTPAEYQLGLARLGIGVSRISRQAVNVIISQNYELGQFCLDSALLSENFYWDEVKKHSGVENPQDEGENE